MSAAGGKVLNGPQQVPGGDGIVRTADPPGAPFALFGIRRQCACRGRLRPGKGKP